MYQIAKTIPGQSQKVAMVKAQGKEFILTKVVTKTYKRWRRPLQGLESCCEGGKFLVVLVAIILIESTPPKILLETENMSQIVVVLFEKLST